MQLNTLAAEVVTNLKTKNLKIATAESCTGGMLAQYITSIAGASQVFEYGIVTYANVIKEHELAVNPQTLETHGAVSEQVCLQMAKGAMVNSGSDLGIGITGIAGPTGGTPDKPIGTVYICITNGDKNWGEKLALKGARETIRQETVENTLKLLKEVIDTL